MSKLSLKSFRGKTVAVSMAGTDVPIFLLDDTQYDIKITPNTTAGAACIALRQLVDIPHDADYAIFEYADDSFRRVDDSMQLARVIQKWSQDSLSTGPRKLYFKRYTYLPGSQTERDELAATSPSMGPHRLAYIDAVYKFLHGYYRFDIPIVVKMAALLLQSSAGKYDASKYVAQNFWDAISEYLPTYSVWNGFRSDCPRIHGMGTTEQALKVDGMRDAVRDAYADLGTMTPFMAQQEFLRLAKEHPAYGCDCYPGKQTWRERDESGDGKGEIAHEDHVMICVGHQGIHLLGMEDPLHIMTFPLAEIEKWTLSRDGKIFAFSLEDKTVIYLVTDVAPYIERSVERYVLQLVNAREGNEDPVMSRSTATLSNSPLPVHAKTIPSKTPPFAVAPETSNWETDAIVNGSGRLGAESAQVSAPASGASPGMQPAAAAASEKQPTAAATASEKQPAAAAASEKQPAAAAASEKQPAAPANTTTAKNSGLPPGWVAITDEDGDEYYYNEVTEESSWEKPTGATATASTAASSTGLPPGWEAIVDDDNGDTYYYNSKTNESSWVKPNPDGSIPEESESTTSEANGLPRGWTVEYDEEGDPYYVNTITNETSWYKPNPDGTIPDE